MDKKKLLNDIILIGALTAAALVLFAVLRLTARAGNTVRVAVDGEVVARYSLSEDRTERIETEYGYNILVIENGCADVTEADCKNGICVRSPKIKNSGETITCLPHHLSVTVEGGDIDFVQ